MIKTFISFDNKCIEIKNEIQQFVNQYYNISDISIDHPIEAHSNEAIRQKIRDENITDATVLILIATNDVAGRKFIDWEIAAAMYDGSKRADGRRNDVCGIVVIDCVQNNIRTGSDIIKQNYEKIVGYVNWINLSDTKTRNKYWYLPDRIVESLIKGASIPIIPYQYINYLLKVAIDYAHQKRQSNIGKYDYSNLRKNNSPRKVYF